jgi:hypothetical protein
MKTPAPSAALMPLVLALCLPTPLAGAVMCVPLYGNWCGPGHPSGPALPPIDGFDAACMRHDFCTAGPQPVTLCDRALVEELNLLAAQVGYLPRPLQWIEYVLRVKAGGGWGGMPTPMPWDAAGLMASVMTPCW